MCPVCHPSLTPPPFSAGLFELNTTVLKAKLTSAANALTQAAIAIVAADCQRVLGLAMLRYKALITRAEQKPTVCVRARNRPAGHSFSAGC